MFLLYILNVIDIIFTLLLMETNIFIEVNSIMQGIINNQILAIVLKVFVVGVLVYFVYKRLDDATEKQLKISNVFLVSMLGIYLFIDFTHIFYGLIYLYFHTIIKIV